MTAKIPHGMSSADAFIALYNNAEVVGRGYYAPNSGRLITSRWNAIQVFKNYCYNNYCDYVRGKLIRIRFDNPRVLDVKNYDQHYGEGSAQKALNAYKETMSNSNPGYNLDCNPCTYFTEQWKLRTPKQDRVDLQKSFIECEYFTRSKENIERDIEEIERINSFAFLKECKAKYTLTPSSVSYDYKECQGVLEHVKRLLESKNSRNINIANLVVRRGDPDKSSVVNFAPQSEVDLATAYKILEAHLSKN